MVNCNEANCTCKMVNCVRHGKCCECINHHREKGSLVACKKIKSCYTARLYFQCSADKEKTVRWGW